MFTFVPASGIYWSPFGSPFYSPAVVTGIYVPQRQTWVTPPMGGVHPFGGAGMSGTSAPPTLGNAGGGGHPGGFPTGSGAHVAGPAHAGGSHR